MESTEHVLEERHLPGCFTLSRSANWNQNEADWRLMLGFGRGWGISTSDGILAASTLALPYGRDFAWLAMVLVLPEHRRQGYASRLLRVALAEMHAQKRVSLLDATPAGHEVYIQEGFRDFWGFKRFFLNSGISVSGKEEMRKLESKDWEKVLALDALAFGGSREAVLRNLAARQPQLALFAQRNGEFAGFVLGREGREALQIGPLVARDDETARGLLAAAIASAGASVYVDIADHAASLQGWALERGFAVQRSFTRMAHGPDSQAPGEASLIYCPAGPELG